MTPTLSDGDIVVSVSGSEFEAQDIIAFYYNNKILVKRVIATAGQWVDIDEEGNVSVNGTPLDEPYVFEKALGECDIDLPYQVPEGRVFVMGDHRSVSVDSRSTSVGCVAQEQIVGKLVFCVWPFTNFGHIKQEKGGVCFGKSVKKTDSFNHEGSQKASVMVSCRNHTSCCCVCNDIYADSASYNDGKQSRVRYHRAQTRHNCYSSHYEKEKELVCTTDSLGVHKHTDACYDAEHKLICGYADFVIHEHDASCYDKDGNLVCTIPEHKLHQHTPECYQMQKQLVCTQEESVGHTHTPECYTKTAGRQLICGKEGDIHTAKVATMQKVI